MFWYRTTRVHQSRSYVHHFAKFNCAWIPCRSNLVSYVRWFFLMISSLPSQDLPRHKTLVLPAHKSEERLTSMGSTGKKYQSGALSTPIIWSVQTTSIINQSKRWFIIKCWKLMGGQNLNHFDRMHTWNRTELLLTLQSPILLYCMKCFGIHELQNMVQQGNQRDSLP